MLHDLDRVTPETLRRLHPTAVEEPAALRALLERLRVEGVPLLAGIDSRHRPREARLEATSGRELELGRVSFDPGDAGELYWSFDLDGRSYFFATRTLDRPGRGRLRVERPRVIYRAERRGRPRQTPQERRSRWQRVALEVPGAPALLASVADASESGLGVELPSGKGAELPDQLRVRFVEGPRQGESAHARICHRSSDGNGGVRLGLALSAVATGPRIPIESRRVILERPARARARDALAIVGGAARIASRRATSRLGWGPDPAVAVPIVDYANEQGQRIRALLDSSGDPHGAPAVLIPPAWGRTKETLWPLAAAVLASFERAGEPVSVLRFDGTQRRGESHLDAACRAPGCEYLHFTFSQAVRDIEASVAFLERTLAPRSVVLVTFSLAAVEGRRAVALDTAGCFGGWISVVGMVDLQSALRTISGGIDYGYGLQRGVSFGRHELVGVVADMDHTGLDALAHGLVFPEDARRDLASVKVPISWIHGRDDAWIDVERVRDALSCGDSAGRRLIEVPTGHQLRTSAEALATFQLVAQEVGRMALGRHLEPVLPAPDRLDARREAERRRLPRVSLDERAFWRDYLLGRSRVAGMQLITATAAYRNLMERQRRRLALAPGARVADLGAGTGEFALHWARRCGAPAPGPPIRPIRIDALDLVPEALVRARERLAGLPGAPALRCLVADLDETDPVAIPLADAAYDAVLASLLVSYLRDPRALLREARRLLRPGGRLVVSSLRRDADISKLYADGMRELEAGAAREVLGAPDDARLSALARDTLNDASRILDLEERGRFRFWDASELAAAVEQAGFAAVRAELDFGDPPQAVVVSALRP